MATLSEILRNTQQYQGSAPVNSLIGGMTGGYNFGKAIKDGRDEQDETVETRESGSPVVNGVTPPVPMQKPALSQILQNPEAAQALQAAAVL